MTNQAIADIFEEVGGLLETQHASPFRVRAWRMAATMVRALPRPLADIYRSQGRAGLEALPHVGHAIAGATIEILESGGARLLERLRGEALGEHPFTELPGIGEVLAERLQKDLGVTTLEGLEEAAHDGRLAALPGFGARRTAMLRDMLAARLEHRRSVGRPPGVETLLEVDALYRQRAAANDLQRVAPRRFNPERHAWLPIMHVERQGWTFTAMYSNTQLAHQLGRTRDWVVLYYDRPGHEGRCTVVTETSGPLVGQRVVRGREAECRALARKVSEQLAEQW